MKMLFYIFPSRKAREAGKSRDYRHVDELQLQNCTLVSFVSSRFPPTPRSIGFCYCQGSACFIMLIFFLPLLMPLGIILKFSLENLVGFSEKKNHKKLGSAYNSAAPPLPRKTEASWSFSFSYCTLPRKFAGTLKSASWQYQMSSKKY